jgi:hypothetical protein
LLGTVEGGCDALTAGDVVGFGEIVLRSLGRLIIAEGRFDAVIVG